MKENSKFMNWLKRTLSKLEPSQEGLNRATIICNNNYNEVIKLKKDWINDLIYEAKNETPYYKQVITNVDEMFIEWINNKKKNPYTISERIINSIVSKLNLDLEGIIVAEQELAWAQKFRFSKDIYNSIYASLFLESYKKDPSKVLYDILYMYQNHMTDYPEYRSFAERYFNTQQINNIEDIDKVRVLPLSIKYAEQEFHKKIINLSDDKLETLYNKSLVNANKENNRKLIDNIVLNLQINPLTHLFSVIEHAYSKGFNVDQLIYVEREFIIKISSQEINIDKSIQHLFLEFISTSSPVKIKNTKDELERRIENIQDLSIKWVNSLPEDINFENVVNKYFLNWKHDVLNEIWIPGEDPVIDVLYYIFYKTNRGSITNE